MSREINLKKTKVKAIKEMNNNVPTVILKYLTSFYKYCHEI